MIKSEDWAIQMLKIRRVEEMQEVKDVSHAVVVNELIML